jgi:hypothetical protein
MDKVVQRRSRIPIYTNCEEDGVDLGGGNKDDGDVASISYEMPPAQDHAKKVCFCKGLGWRASIAYNVQLNLIICKSNFMASYEVCTHKTMR